MSSGVWAGVWGFIRYYPLPGALPSVVIRYWTGWSRNESCTPYHAGQARRSVVEMTRVRRTPSAGGDHLGSGHALLVDGGFTVQ